MAVFTTESFEFYDFNPNLLLHETFVNTLINDESITKWLPYLNEALFNPKFSGLSQRYLVGQEDSLIGFFIIYRAPEKPFELELSGGIKSELRSASGEPRQLREQSKETIGSRMLRETSNFLLAEHHLTKLIALQIDYYNIKSIKSALHAGFVRTHDPSNSRLEKYTKTEPTDYIKDISGKIRR